MPASQRLYEYLVIDIRNYVEVRTKGTVSPEFMGFVLDLCDSLKTDNRHFDEEKFLKACRLKS